MATATASIRTKAEFFRLWRLGVLGNSIRVWDQIADVAHVSHVGFREMAVAGGGEATIVPFALASATYQQWKSRGLRFVMDEACPNDLTTLCGEVARVPGLVMQGRLAIEPRCSMRQANERGQLRNLTGAQIRRVVDCYMDPSSQDDLDQLLDLYPDAVVEFSCFTKDVGLLPHRNTIFWEVRNY